MGAVFPDVPAIKLPQVGGGLVQYDDTTDADATAEDIAKGKTAYVNGVKVTGTASGGGGNIIVGTFNYGEECIGTEQRIILPYKGNGFPISISFYRSVGTKNPDVPRGNSNYPFLQGTIAKQCITGQYAEPHYAAHMNRDYGSYAMLYQNGTSYSYMCGEGAYIYDSTGQCGTGGNNCLLIRDNKTLSVFIKPNGSKYGFMPGWEHTYVVVYSE